MVIRIAVSRNQLNIATMEQFERSHSINCSTTDHVPIHTVPTAQRLNSHQPFSFQEYRELTKLVLLGRVATIYKRTSAWELAEAGNLSCTHITCLSLQLPNTFFQFWCQDFPSLPLTCGHVSTAVPCIAAVHQHPPGGAGVGAGYVSLITP